MHPNVLCVCGPKHVLNFQVNVTSLCTQMNSNDRNPTTHRHSVFSCTWFLVVWKTVEWSVSPRRSVFSKTTPAHRGVRHYLCRGIRSRRSNRSTCHYTANPTFSSGRSTIINKKKKKKTRSFMLYASNVAVAARTRRKHVGFGETLTFGAIMETAIGDEECYCYWERTPPVEVPPAVDCQAPGTIERVTVRYLRRFVPLPPPTTPKMLVPTWDVT